MIEGISLHNEYPKQDDIWFITKEEEIRIIDEINKTDIRKYGMCISDKELQNRGSLPDYQKFILERAYEEHIIDEYPDHLTISIIEPGKGIKPFIDSHKYDGQILILALNDTCSFDFYYKGEIEEVPCIQRSLLSLEYDARYKWKRGVTSRKYDIVNNEKHNRDTCYLLTYRYSKK